MRRRSFHLHLDLEELESEALEQLGGQLLPRLVLLAAVRRVERHHSRWQKQPPLSQKRSESHGRRHSTELPRLVACPDRPFRLYHLDQVQELEASWLQWAALLRHSSPPSVGLPSRRAEPWQRRRGLLPQESLRRVCYLLELLLDFQGLGYLAGCRHRRLL